LKELIPRLLASKIMVIICHLFLQIKWDMKLGQRAKK